MAEVRSDGDENFCWLKSSKNFAISCWGDIWRESDFDEDEDERVSRFRDFEIRESEMKKCEREILKKSKVKWEVGTVECAREREGGNVCEWGK